MKRLLRIFELSKSEQRLILIVMLILIAIAFLGYERRIHRSQVQSTPAAEAKLSPDPSEAEDVQ
jgi:hypothetical protein